MVLGLLTALVANILNIGGRVKPLILLQGTKIYPLAPHRIHPRDKLVLYLVFFVEKKVEKERAKPIVGK